MNRAARAAIPVALLAACGDAQPTSNTIKEHVVLGVDPPYEVTLDNETPLQVPVVLVAPQLHFTRINLDMAGSLSRLRFSPTSTTGASLRSSLGLAASRKLVELDIRIAEAAKRATVCTEGAKYGTFNVSGDSPLVPAAIEPGAAELSAPTLEVIDKGPFAVCVEVRSYIMTTASVGGLAVDIEYPCTEEPEDLGGIWVGTYTCTNTCPPGFGGDIELEVRQTGREATYAEVGEYGEGSVFGGRVCGKVFSFSYNSLGEVERGTFTLNADGTATKRSSWSSSFGGCSGECTDQLHRK